MKEIDKENLHKNFRNYMLDRNEENLKILFLEYKNLIYSIAYYFLKNKYDAEDTVQNVFLKIYSIDQEQLPINNEFSWLYTVVKNESINLLKKNYKNITYDNLEIPDNENISSKIIGNDEYNSLIKHVGKLERNIISLKLISNLSFKEISNLLNISVYSVEWKYYKSINLLKRFFQED